MKRSAALIPNAVLALLICTPALAWDRVSGFSYYREGSSASHGIAVDQSRHWTRTSLFYSDRRGSYALSFSEPRHRSSRVVYHGPVHSSYGHSSWYAPAGYTRITHHYGPVRYVHGPSPWYGPAYSVLPAYGYYSPVIIHQGYLPPRVIHREVRVVHHHHRPRYHHRSSPRHHRGPVGIQPGWRH